MEEPASRSSRCGWRWANVPLPEPLLVAVGAGVALQVMLPMQLPIGSRTARVCGTALVAGGGALVVWAVGSAQDASVDRLDRLVTGGAYRYTRNPMYVGCTAGVAGAGLGTRNAWLAIATVAAARALHREVLVEEARLRRRFGEPYVSYRKAVPRYLPAARAWTGLRRILAAWPRTA